MLARTRVECDLESPQPATFRLPVVLVDVTLAQWFLSLDRTDPTTTPRYPPLLATEVSLLRRSKRPRAHGDSRIVALATAQVSAISEPSARGSFLNCEHRVARLGLLSGWCRALRL